MPAIGGAWLVPAVDFAFSSGHRIALLPGLGQLAAFIDVAALAENTQGEFLVPADLPGEAFDQLSSFFKHRFIFQ